MSLSSIKAVFFYSESNREFNSGLLKRSLSVLNSFSKDSEIYSNRKQAGVKTVDGNFMQCLENIALQSCSEERDTIAVFRGISPVLDASLLGEALSNHSRYLSHHTFSENIPDGIVPDLISLEYIQAIPADKKETIRSWKDLRAFALKNIDDYDIDIFYRSPDLRQYRLDFSCEDDRSEALARALLAKADDPSYENLKKIIFENPDALRPAPSYVEISLTDRSPVVPVFIPELKSSHDLSPENLDKILYEISAHPFKNDLTVSLAGTGEPMLYENIFSVLEKILTMDTVKTLYLETYGASFSKEDAAKFSRIVNPEKLRIIFRLTTLDEKRYQKLYGKDLLKLVLENVESFCSLSNGISLYAEMIKIKDVEDEIENYFNYFEARKVSVILSKFNRYIDKLEERRVSDLTPLHRDFCWHLARDVFITSEGKIPLCRQDLSGERQCGSLEKEGLYAAFQNNLPSFTHSLRLEHDQIPMPCLECDEWYTFMG